MDINQALEKLFAMRQFSVKLGLDNVKGLLHLIGNPHKKLKCFHIAGSNGKGSTASFLSSILIEHGYKTGLYTSPHILKFNERIRINGLQIDDEYIGNFIKEIDDYIVKYEPTFFEITTALAFKYFADSNIDYAVIEVGLGGRLDATNLIENPIACLITSISLEHTNILGSEISKIAWEKAGIIKQNSKVFISNLLPEAIKSIKNVCIEKSAELNLLTEQLDISNNQFQIELDKKTFNIYELPLLGNHQFFNAALAISVFTKIFENFDEIKISKGLQNVVKNSGHSCRLEKVNSLPDIIFDAAHNIEGIDSLLSFIKKRKNSYSELNVLFGVLNDKNYFEMIKRLSSVFDKIYLTTFDNPKAVKIEELLQSSSVVLENTLPVYDKIKFIESFIASKKTDSVLFVVGSIYMLGEILSKKSLKIA